MFDDCSEVRRVTATAADPARLGRGLGDAARIDLIRALEDLKQPAWRSHLREVREQLRERRDLLVGGLRRLAPDVDVQAVPAGGPNLWARLPEGTDVEEVVRRCERSGVLVAPGDEWFPAEPAGPFVRLNYSGPDPACSEVGAAALGRALTG